MGELCLQHELEALELDASALPEPPEPDDVLSATHGGPEVTKR